MARRDQLLHEMGITQWQLRRTDVFKGVVNMEVDLAVRLLIISDEDILLQSTLIQDILRCMNIDTAQCLAVTTQTAVHLNLQHQPLIWLIGEKSQQSTFHFIQQDLCWKTPAFHLLHTTSAEKRKLWQQMQSTLISTE